METFCFFSLALGYHALSWSLSSPKSAVQTFYPLVSDIFHPPKVIDAQVLPLYV